MYEYENQVKSLAEIIRNSNNICLFSGVGISCASGIPDFRSADGLYNQKTTTNYPPETIISHSFFISHPELFYEFYKTKMLYPDAKPNDAHIFFAELERKGKNISVVTQNIDGLHQQAGSTEVHELHGTVHRNFCTKCGRQYDLDYVLKSDGVPYCKDDNGIIKPDVVLYEEQLDENVIMKSIDAIRNADTVIVVGTSLTVYPAASFVRYYKGSNLILINKSQTSYDDIAKIVINDNAEKVVRLLFDRI